jgi:hypothetical protein
MKKERGKFLTAMLVLGAFGYLQSLYYLTNTNLVEQAYGTVPGWFPLYALISLAIGVAITVGIWMLKKWAVYLLAFSTGMAFLTQLFILKPVQAGQLTYYMTMISAGLWFWAIYRKWKNFD